MPKNSEANPRGVSRNLPRGGKGFPIFLVVCLGGLLSAAETQTQAADRIILRDLTIINQQVSKYNVDGVTLEDGTLLRWSQIERGRLEGDRQDEFSKLLEELGKPLYLLEQRLKVGDYKDALSHAEALYPKYKLRGSDTSYLVCQSLMWSRMAVGRREEAVEPYLQCLEFLRNRREPFTLPGKRRLQFDPKTGLSPELPPIWFDSKAAASCLPELQKVILSIQRPRPEGIYLYYASLALAAGNPAAATRPLAAVRTAGGPVAEIKTILAAQQEIQQGEPATFVKSLATAWPRFSAETRPLALYWLGVAASKSEDQAARESGLLDWLRIPALYGQDSPELAGAALYYTMKSLQGMGDVRGSVAVRNELLASYGQTYFASRLRTASDADREETP